ncbi:MAG: hypothetical protein RR922_04370 [Clostridia bacterium]
MKNSKKKKIAKRNRDIKNNRNLKKQEDRKYIMSFNSSKPATGKNIGIYLIILLLLIAFVISIFLLN